MSDSLQIRTFGHLLTESIPKPQPPVSKLYHYTSFDAIKEMLGSHTVHLTHAAFLNDPTELSYGLGLMQNMFGEKGKAVFGSFDFLSSLHYTLQPYIFCLSETEDLLSQWEMYSGRNGCCITFGPEISRLTQGGDVALAPVMYEEETQNRYLENLNNQRKNPEYQQEEQKASTSLYFLLSVVFLKSFAFSHEKEWRIVRIVHQDSLKEIKYRSGSRFLKPYVSIRCEPLPITEIRIGPADDQDRLLRSVEHLTKMTEGYQHVAVTRSTIRVSPS